MLESGQESIKANMESCREQPVRVSKGKNLTNIWIRTTSCLATSPKTSAERSRRDLMPRIPPLQAPDFQGADWMEVGREGYKEMLWSDVTAL